MLTVTKKNTLDTMVHVIEHPNSLGECENEYRRVHTEHGDPPNGVAYAH